MARIPLQQTYDTVVEHLRKQGKQCVDQDGQCVYWSSENLKCAAGCLIPEEKYSEKLEGVSLMMFTDTGIELSLAGRLLKKLGHDVKLVRHLQAIHDDYEPWAWEERFEKCCREFNLTYTPPVTP